MEVITLLEFTQVYWHKQIRVPLGYHMTLIVL